MFPGTILARKVYSEKVCAYASSGLVMEEGANAHPGETSGKRENAGSGVALERGFATGINVDGFA